MCQACQLHAAHRVPHLHTAATAHVKCQQRYADWHNNAKSVGVFHDSLVATCSAVLRACCSICLPRAQRHRQRCTHQQCWVLAQLATGSNALVRSQS
jgi:hypothetical protein